MNHQRIVSQPHPDHQLMLAESGATPSYDFGGLTSEGRIGGRFAARYGERNHGGEGPK